MNTLLVAAAVVVFVAGFTFGLAVGLVVRKLPREVDMQVRDIKAFMHKRQASLVGVFLVLMALLTYQSQRESGSAVDGVQEQSTCLTQYANRLYDSLKPRQGAAEALQAADQEFNAALVDLFKEALAPNPDREAGHRAVVRVAKAARHKQAVSDRLSNERAHNPYPAPPKEACPK